MHGWEAFDWQIIGECSDKGELNSAERYFIKLWRTKDPEFGYNLTNGGDGGCAGGPRSESWKNSIRVSIKRVWKQRTDEQRASIGEKIAHSNTGKKNPHTAEWNEKISQSNKGKIMSAEARQKISVAQKGRRRSAEFKARLSATNKGKRPAAHVLEAARRARIGMKHDEAARQKMRDAWVRRRARQQEKG